MTEKLTRAELEKHVSDEMRLHTAIDDVDEYLVHDIVRRLETRAGLPVAPEPVAPKRVQPRVHDKWTYDTEIVNGMIAISQLGAKVGVVVTDPQGCMWVEVAGLRGLENPVYWVGSEILYVPGVVDTPEPVAAESREEVAEAIARLLEQFGENVDGDPIKPDIAAWVAREYGRGVPRRYVATRDENGNIRVRGGYGIFIRASSSQSDIERAARRNDKFAPLYQAALDLIDSEEKEAGE